MTTTASTMAAATTTTTSTTTIATETVCLVFSLPLSLSLAYFHTFADVFVSYMIIVVEFNNKINIYYLYICKKKHIL